MVHDAEQDSQAFYLGHNEDICCLGIHPKGRLIATGQSDPKGAETPYLAIWDSTTQAEVAKLYYHERSVAAVTFSPDGDRIATIGRDHDNTICIWDWKKDLRLEKDVKRVPITFSPTGKDPMRGVAWHPDGWLVTFGEKVCKVHGRTALGRAGGRPWAAWLAQHLCPGTDPGAA